MYVTLLINHVSTLTAGVSNEVHCDYVEAFSKVINKQTGLEVSADCASFSCMH